MFLTCVLIYVVNYEENSINLVSQPPNHVPSCLKTMCLHDVNLVDTRFNHVPESMRRKQVKSMCPHASFPLVGLLVVEVSVLTLFFCVRPAHPRWDVTWLG